VLSHLASSYGICSESTFGWIVALLMDTHYSTAQRINLPSHLSDRSHHVSMLLVEQSISDMESGSILKNSAKFWTYLQVCVKIE
jgi:hypothetical protein